MSDLEIKILPGVFVNDGLFDMDSALESKEDYIPLTLDINNVPKVICDMLIREEIFSPKKDDDFKLMRMIYSTDLEKIDDINRLIVCDILNLNIKDRKELYIFKQLQNLFEILIKLNLYDKRVNILKKEKIKQNIKKYVN